jgi:hypothetical protein
MFEEYLVASQYNLAIDSSKSASKRDAWSQLATDFEEKLDLHIRQPINHWTVSFQASQYPDDVYTLALLCSQPYGCRIGLA